MGRYWQKARDKEIGKLLVDFDAAGWSIEDPPTYYKVKCPCGKHMRWIHLTPSGNNYVGDTRKWLERQSCSGKDED